MAIKLMYITNNATVAEIADSVGVDRVFIDLETVGKRERQANRDTVISSHRLEDIDRVSSVLKNAKLLVRANPIYEGFEKELDTIAKSGADIVMLPYFSTAAEVKSFVRCINGRKRTCLLFETPASVEKTEEILDVGGIDEVFIGLNDLHLGYGLRFMFELLANGTVDRMCEAFKKRGIPYGFGGVARLNCGTLKAELILGEHYRLGSDCVILSRSFCNQDLVADTEQLRRIMTDGVAEIRDYERFLSTADNLFFESNRKRLIKCVNEIVEAAEK